MKYILNVYEIERICDGELLIDINNFSIGPIEVENIKSISKKEQNQIFKMIQNNYLLDNLGVDIEEEDLKELITKSIYEDIALKISNKEIPSSNIDENALIPIGNENSFYAFSLKTKEDIITSLENEVKKRIDEIYSLSDNNFAFIQSLNIGKLNNVYISDSQHLHSVDYIIDAVSEELNVELKQIQEEQLTKALLRMIEHHEYKNESPFLLADLERETVDEIVEQKELFYDFTIGNVFSSIIHKILKNEELNKEEKELLK